MTINIRHIHFLHDEVTCPECGADTLDYDGHGCGYSDYQCRACGYSFRIGGHADDAPWD